MNESAKYRLDNFELYRTARNFRTHVYKVLPELPKEEKFCLVPQMRRAAISVTNNIAEGHGRWHYQENTQFCRIARGSIEELIDDFNISLDENYCDPQIAESLKVEAYALIQRINGYVVYLRKSKQGINEQ